MHSRTYLLSRTPRRKVWVLGNVEEVLVARSSVDPKKAVLPGSSDYLRSLPKDARPRGAYINDQKAIFMCRWYQEADSTGKILTGYQNANCAEYFLPQNNASLAFEYISILQERSFHFPFHIFCC